MGVVVIIHHFLEGVESYLQRLTEMTIPSLQPDCVLIWAKHGGHELGRAPGAGCKLLMIVSIHGIRINPVDISQALNVFGFLPIDKVSNKKTLSSRLHKMIVTLGTTCCCSAS